MPPNSYSIWTEGVLHYYILELKQTNFRRHGGPPVTVNLGTKNFALQNNFHIFFNLYSNTLLHIFISQNIFPIFLQKF
jgi:hypothetical protein